MDIKDFDKVVQLKLSLLEKFGSSGDLNSIEFCERAYEFLSRNDVGIINPTMGNLRNSVGDVNPMLDGGSKDFVRPQPVDGVYLVYEKTVNGKTKRWCELFVGSNSKENVKHVAFKFGQVSLILYDKDIVDVSMETEDGGDEIDCIKTCEDAASDFNGKYRTSLLAKRRFADEKLNAFDFKEWYIPSLSELSAMFIMKKCINHAIAYINNGSEPLEGVWYWSSAEFSAYTAWYLYFSNGGVHLSNKKNSYRVRPVAAFNPLIL